MNSHSYHYSGDLNINVIDNYIETILSLGKTDDPTKIINTFIETYKQDSLQKGSCKDKYKESYKILDDYSGSAVIYKKLIDYYIEIGKIIKNYYDNVKIETLEDLDINIYLCTPKR